MKNFNIIQLIKRIYTFVKIGMFKLKNEVFNFKKV